LLWKLSADAFAVFHGLNVGFVVLGPLWAWRRPWIRAVHFAALWYNFYLSASGTYCPMTNFENSLRYHYDPSTTYATGFIVRYLKPMLWWDLTQRHVVFAMIAWAVGWTAVYFWLWFRKKGPPPP
jgi:hypothetical protein